MNKNETDVIILIEKIFKIFSICSKIFKCIILTVIGLFILLFLALMFITNNYKGQTFNYKNWKISIENDGSIKSHNKEYDKVNHVPYNIDFLNMIITVDDNKKVNVEETVSFIIFAEQLRPIYRNIFFNNNCYDYKTDNSNGLYAITMEKNYMSINLDPNNKWLTGTQTFKINYSYQIKTSSDDNFIQIPLNIPDGDILPNIKINKLTFKIILPENMNIKKTEIIGANNNASYNNYHNIVTGEIIDTSTRTLLLTDIENY